MTVQELITHLQKFPSDTMVVYQLFSEHAVLDAEEITYVDKSEKRFVYRPENTRETVFKYRSYQTPDEKANFISVVEFPGN